MNCVEWLSIGSPVRGTTISTTTTPTVDRITSPSRSDPVTSPTRQLDTADCLDLTKAAGSPSELLPSFSPSVYFSLFWLTIISPETVMVQVESLVRESGFDQIEMDVIGHFF